MSAVPLAALKSDAVRLSNELVKLHFRREGTRNPAPTSQRAQAYPGSRLTHHRTTNLPLALPPQP